jgi:prevent-host-death family protein
LANDVSQRDLRTHTARLLRRVAAGERLRITVQGHPVAELAPVGHVEQFAPFDQVVSGLRGLLDPDDRLDQGLTQLDEPSRDPFA